VHVESPLVDRADLQRDELDASLTRISAAQPPQHEALLVEALDGDRLIDRATEPILALDTQREEPRTRPGSRAGERKPLTAHRRQRQLGARVFGGAVEGENEELERLDLAGCLRELAV